MLTHLHPDHAGLARRVLAECGCALERLDAPASANDALREITLRLDARRDGARVEGVCERDLEDMIGIALAGDGREPVPTPDRLLRSDDVLLTRSGEWRVLAGAGHSPNQLVLHDAGHARVISADTVYPEIRPFLE